MFFSFSLYHLSCLAEFGFDSSQEVHLITCASLLSGVDMTNTITFLKLSVEQCIGPPANKHPDLIKSFSSELSIYQTSQRFPVFIGVPTGQWKCWLNSGKLASVPITLYRGGLWASVTSPSWALSGVRTEHHTYKRKNETKKIILIYQIGIYPHDS